MWSRPDNFPSWISLEPPSGPRFEPASRLEREAIEQAIGPCTVIERIVLQRTERRHFKVERAGGQSLFFLWHKQPGDDADYEIANWLAAHGVPTPQPVIPPRDSPSGRFSARHFVFHRPSTPTAEDLAAIGKTVASMHLALSAHPSRSRWINLTNARLRRLNDVREALRSGTLQSGPKPEQLAALARRDDLDFNASGEQRIPLHGDLNIGNLLISLDSGSAYVIDFEDVQHSVLPLAFELSLIIERHILVREMADDIAGDAARSFLRAYASHIGSATPALPMGEDLFNAVLSLNLRSLCVLALLEQDGVNTVAEEWEKFFSLFRQSEQRADFWRTIA